MHFYIKNVCIHLEFLSVERINIYSLFPGGQIERQKKQILSLIIYYIFHGLPSSLFWDSHPLGVFVYNPFPRVCLDLS